MQGYPTIDERNAKLSKKMRVSRVQDEDEGKSVVSSSEKLSSAAPQSRGSKANFRERQ